MKGILPFILEDIFLHLRTDFHLEILFCFLFQDGIFFEVSKQPWKAQRPIFQAQHGHLSLAPPPPQENEEMPPPPQKKGNHLKRKCIIFHIFIDFQGIAVGFQGSKTLPVFFFGPGKQRLLFVHFHQLEGPPKPAILSLPKKWHGFLCFPGRSFIGGLRFIGSHLDPLHFPWSLIFSSWASDSPRAPVAQGDVKKPWYSDFLF